jgi:alpha/beta superfamily hydrolase
VPLGVSRQLAEALAARGIASLRYDKRGVGASAGSFLAAGSWPPA